MSSEAPYRPTVLIADDHVVMAEGLAATLGPAFDVVGMVSTLSEIRPAIERFAPDLVVLDLSFAGKSALPLLVELAADRSIMSRFVVLTGFESNALAHAAYQAGAMAFLLKGIGTAELRDAMISALEGHPATPSDTRAGSRAQGYGPRIPIAGIKLRARHLEVLCLLLDGNRRNQVAEKLSITLKGVDYHLSELRELVGTPTQQLLLLWATEHEPAIRSGLNRMRSLEDELR